jgi:hypothetical protein
MASNAETLPTSLFIKSGIALEDRDPSAQGGFADVFKAAYCGEPIAVKRLRLDKQAESHQVSVASSISTGMMGV